jgi:LSD1 subclass zinc finger protein
MTHTITLRGHGRCTSGLKLIVGADLTRGTKPIRASSCHTQF